MRHAILTYGQRFPLLGLGTWKSSKDELYTAIRKAIEIGYRHIDCAVIYHNQEIIGKALNDAIKVGDITRESLWITSKLWNSDHAPADVLPACEKTLKELKLDYLDLYLIHWPVAQEHSVGLSIPEDPSGFIPLNKLPITVTWQSMEELVEKEIVNAIGVSNFSVSKLTDLINEAAIKPVVNQVESHPFLVQKELLDFCKKNGIVMTAYSPLGSRDRSEVFKVKDEPSLLENPVINDIAKMHGVTSAQVLIAWQLHRNVAVIPKSVNPIRLQENFDSIKVELTEEDMNAIASLNSNYRFISGGVFTSEGSPYNSECFWE